MKKLQLSLVLFAMLCMVTTTLSAKNVDYWQGKGRIALSSDGNMHDNDDHYATKMTLMILAKAHLQDKVTLYTYSDHIWGSEDNDEAKMKEAAVETGKLFGFNNCNFMAAVEDPEAAYDAMAAEIAKSTAADPLFIIAAGPMQVVGEGFDRANKTNPDALNYVTIISHSNWNENHSDNNGIGNGSNPETEHFGWTWKEMSAKFGTKVNFNHIVDQNGTGTGSEVYKTKDKFAAKTLAEWAFLKNHPDPKVQWVYQSPLVGTGTDYSDAGMAYYFCADLNGVRGDEGGNRTKLQQWLGTDIIDVTVDNTKVWGVAVAPASATIDEVGQTKQLTATIDPTTALNKEVTWSTSDAKIATVDATGKVTAVAKGQATITATTKDGNKTAKSMITVGKAEAGDVTVGADFIAFEAEATKSPISGNWKVVKVGDPGYVSVIGGEPCSGAYITTTEGKPDGLGVTAGANMLQYVFTPKTSGTYTLTGRMAQNMKCEAGTAWDQCNDIYIKMEGDYTSTTALNVLQGWNKYYGRGHESAKDAKWGSFAQIDVNHAKYKTVYNLKAGETYTLSISPRSKGIIIDYFILAKAAFKFGEQVDIATANDARFLPGAAIPAYANETYLGSDFTVITDASKTNIAAKDFVTAKLDYRAPKTDLSIVDWCKWGAAEVAYQGEDADVNIFINTLLEEDGESTFKLYLNNKLVGEVTNDMIHGTDIANYTAKQTKLNGDTKVAIKKGDMIRVEFNSATNGKVPEGNTTATSRGRWASVQVTTLDTPSTGDSGSDLPSEAPILVSHNLPTEVNVADTSFPMAIEYTSTASVDMVITIHNKTDNVTSGIAFVRTNGIAAGTKVKLEVEVPIETALLMGKEYQWSIYFMPLGGTWQNQYAPLNIPFTCIDDKPTETGIEGVEAAQFSAVAIDNAIVVNCEEAQMVTVYSITGAQIASEAVEAGTTCVADGLAKGIYIVNNTKVIVK